MKNITNRREENPENNHWIWKNLWKSMKQCQPIIMDSTLNIGGYSNGDETKRHVLPLNDDDLSIIITLGIGHDTAAEEKLLKALKGPSKFYGADPVYEINAQKYNKFGTFFNFGVGAGSGMFNLSVLVDNAYTTRFLPIVDMVHFLKKIIKLDFIDDIWIDNEGAEYGLLPYFVKDGELDQNNITVCQWNCEIHYPNEEMKKKFHEFLFRILDDKRYAFFLPVQGKHLRMFFFNFANEKCMKKMRAVTLFTQMLVAIAVLMSYLYLQSEDTHNNLENLKSLGNFDRIFEKKSQSWVQEEFDLWHDCISKNLSIHRGDPDKLWWWIKIAIVKCENLLESFLHVQDYANGDETKRHITPLNKDSSVIVTLGIGHDTASEQKLLAALNWTHTDFYGCDPMYEINADLYRKFGTFFNFAIGAHGGVFNLSVMDKDGRYTTKIVPAVEFVYFLKEILKINFYDNIWIDNEKAEYPMLEYFFKGGQLDQNDITVCQWNVEIHSPEAAEKKQIHDFIFRMLDERRYAWTRPVKVRNLRLYSINFENPKCIDKYIRKNPNP